MKKFVLIIASLFGIATTAFAQLGSLSSDLVFTPITPCRILDTRTSSGGPGPIPAAGTVAYYAAGRTNYSAQGGVSTDCGLNSAGANKIAAVVVNFTVVTPATGGFVTVYPFGGTRPEAATVNFTAGSVVGNGATVKVSQTAGSIMSIYSTSTTDVVADVTGYYVMPVSVGSLECVQTAFESVPIPANYSGFHYTTSTCSAGQIATNSYCYNDNNSNLYSTGSGTNGGAWCGWRNTGGTAVTASQGTLCCRIPGR